MTHPLSRRATARRPGGFTLVELLVVIGIIALLIGILLPSLSRARASAKTLVCLSQVRQTAFAFQLYANEYEGIVIPENLPGFFSSAPWFQWGASVDGSWPAKTRPYINEGDENQSGVAANKNFNEFLSCPEMLGNYPLENHADSHYALNLNLRGTDYGDYLSPASTPFNWKYKKFVNFDNSASIALLIDGMNKGRTVWPEGFTPDGEHIDGVSTAAQWDVSILPHPSFKQGTNVLFLDGHGESVATEDVPSYTAESVEQNGDPQWTPFWGGGQPNQSWPFARRYEGGGSDATP